MAIPWTASLDADGSYDGFDIMPAGVEGCRSAITPRHGRFRFHRADIRNSFNNPGGSIEPADYRFEFPDATFDPVFSTSVLTSLPPTGIDRYVSETARVLRPGGACLHTFFLLDDASLAGICRGGSALDFRFEMDGFRTTNERYPEAAVAVPQATIDRACAGAGLAITTVIHGAWSGRPGGTGAKDFIVAGKVASPCSVCKPVACTLLTPS
jgi:SAM-dependent methyltransferase